MPQYPTDSAQQGGATGQPDQSTSPQGGQQNSQNTDMPEWAKTLNKRLDNIERMTQGDKDRAVSKVSKELESYKPILQKVSKMLGADEAQMAQVERELEYDALKARVFGEQQGNAATGNRQEPTADMVSEVAKAWGLSLEDAEVVNTIRGGDALTAMKKMAELAARRAQAPQPTQAVNAATPAGASQVSLSDGDVAEMTKRLDNLYKNPTQNRVEIARLEKALGW